MGRPCPRCHLPRWWPWFPTRTRIAPRARPWNSRQPAPMASPWHSVHGSTRVLLDKKFTFRDGDRLTAQQGSIIFDAHAHHAASTRRLERHEPGLAKPLPPVVSQATVSGTRDRVFIDAGCRCEEARDEIETGVGGMAGHDDA